MSLKLLKTELLELGRSLNSCSGTAWTSNPSISALRSTFLSLRKLIVTMNTSSRIGHRATALSILSLYYSSPLYEDT